VKADGHLIRAGDGKGFGWHAVSIGPELKRAVTQAPAPQPTSAEGGGYKTQLALHNGRVAAQSAMPVIRFVREGRDVECYPGENLREVALREGVELYGLKGKLGNCGGCGQCITCFVDVVAESSPGSLSGRTAVEEQKLRRRPESWRLACQTLVQHSVLVLTRPQVGLGDAEQRIAKAQTEPLPAGPTAWPVVESAADDDADDEATLKSEAEAGTDPA
jgi:ferredoxin